MWWLVELQQSLAICLTIVYQMSDDDLPLPPEGLTYYQLLGVSEDAPEQEIQRSYRQLIKIYHPDQWSHWAAEDIARRLRNAYDVLTDPRKRQRYNQDGHKAYTGEKPADLPDIEDWVNTITSKIDVEHPAQVSNVTEGEEGIIDIDDEFETSDETLTAEEIFDEVEEEIEDASFDDVAQEAEEEQEWEEPDYTSDESGVGYIDKDDEPETVYKSYEERVKEKARGSSRSRDPSAAVQRERPKEDPKEKPVTETNEADNLTLKDRLTGLSQKPVEFAEKYLSDDVVSRAVRRAWVVRISSVAGILILISVIAEILALGGVTIPLIPTVSGMLSGTGLLFIVAGSFIVFAFDQMNTERDNNPGAINVANKPSIYTGLTVVINGIGLLLFGYAAQRGFDPYAAVTNILNGDLPVGVWTDISFNLGPLAGGAVLNGVIAVVMVSSLVLGFLFGFAAVTRYVWYYRYVKAYRVMPLWWDYSLTVMAISGLWILLTGASSIPIPNELGEILLDIAPEMMGVLAIQSGSIGMPGGLAVAAGAPTIVGILLLTRVTIERIVRR